MISNFKNIYLINILLLIAFIVIIFITICSNHLQSNYNNNTSSIKQMRFLENIVQRNYNVNLEVISPTLVKSDNRKLIEYNENDTKPGNVKIQFRLNASDINSLPLNALEIQKYLRHNSTKIKKSNVEEFTVIVTTIRKKSLYPTLMALNFLYFVNQVIIIWNSESPPSVSLNKWPFKNLAYPYRIFHNGKNSLNNRFLPLEEIETEAVLSIDDDIMVKHESILLGFNLWKQFRDRIVGYFGRQIVWNPKNERWTYLNFSCSKSLVLTGCAFINKKYFSIYTYLMPQLIRDEVDNKTNCEDIAMNFLVSHITKKSPIIITNHRLCLNCIENKKVSLWRNRSHFRERELCIISFSKVYGYTPLFNPEIFATLFDVEAKTTSPPFSNKTVKIRGRRKRKCPSNPIMTNFSRAVKIVLY